MKGLDFSSLSHAILASAAYMIIATDEEGNVLVFNREAEHKLGYSADEIVGRQTPLAWHDPEEIKRRAVELSQELGRPVAPGFAVFTVKPNIFESEEREWTFIHKDGLHFPVSLSVTSLRDAQAHVTGYLSIAKDITKQQHIERMKSEFISVVSHELRTPLTSIRGALGLIAGGAVGSLPDKAKELVIIAHKNSERLVHIINDILDIEKIESGKMQLNLRRIRLEPFLKQALEANQAYGDKYHVRFVLEEAPQEVEVMADADRLMQVMANLLSNAAKFSPQGAEVSVRASRGKGSVLFEVRDCGAGIPEEFRQHIFEKFAQADASTTRRYEGTGLGLSITRQLVEAMGGSIGFDTKIGQGTVFFFYLPEADAAPGTATAAPVLSEDACWRVLICEDDETTSALMELMLKEKGFMTEIARDVGEARRKLNAGHYAAMTLDLVMPFGDGVEFLSELRSRPATRGLPVVVVSSKADKAQQVMNGSVIGVSDWLMKPVDPVRLAESLKKAIERRQTGLPRVLHIEDDADLSNVLATALNGKAELISAMSLQAAEYELRNHHFDLIVLDPAMPDGDGLDFLDRLNDLVAMAPVMILSASEIPREAQGRAAIALVKSRLAESRVVEMILNMVGRSA